MSSNKDVCCLYLFNQYDFFFVNKKWYFNDGQLKSSDAKLVTTDLVCTVECSEPFWLPGPHTIFRTDFQTRF